MTAPAFRVLVLENEAFAWQLVKALGAVGIQSGALVRAADAFAHIRSNPQIQGVSVDFNLFGSHTGVDFAAEALAIRPALKLVLLSANLIRPNLGRGLRCAVDVATQHIAEAYARVGLTSCPTLVAFCWRDDTGGVRGAHGERSPLKRRRRQW